MLFNPKKKTNQYDLDLEKYWLPSVIVYGYLQ